MNISEVPVASRKMPRVKRPLFIYAASFDRLQECLLEDELYDRTRDWRVDYSSIFIKTRERQTLPFPAPL